MPEHPIIVHQPGRAVRARNGFDRPHEVEGARFLAADGARHAEGEHAGLADLIHEVAGHAARLLDFVPARADPGQEIPDPLRNGARFHDFLPEVPDRGGFYRVVLSRREYESRTVPESARTSPEMVHAPPESRDRRRLEISRAPGLPSVELHAGTAFAHSYPGHWHDEFFVTAITEGEGVFGYRGTEHRATRGTLVFVVPGEVHSHGSGRGGRSFRSLHAGNPLVTGLAPELPQMAGPAGLRSFAITDATLLGEFLLLHRLLEEDGSALRKESRLLAFFVKLVGRVPDVLPPETASGQERAAVRQRDDSSTSPAPHPFH